MYVLGANMSCRAVPIFEEISEKEGKVRFKDVVPIGWGSYTAVKLDANDPDCAATANLKWTSACKEYVTT